LIRVEALPVVAQNPSRFSRLDRLIYRSPEARFFCSSS
jgi:hypothetical protein